MARDLYFKAPRLDGTNYYTWKLSLEYHLNSLSFVILDIIKNSYIVPNGGPTTLNGIKNHENNAKTRNVLIRSLSESFFFKINGCTSARKI